MSALQQFYQSRHNRDANSHHTTQTDRHAQRKLLYVALQRNFNLFNVALQRCLGSSKISLCDKPFVDELCLFFGQNLGLRFGHTRCGQALYKAMRVKCNCVHGAKLTCDNDSGKIGKSAPSSRNLNATTLSLTNATKRGNTINSGPDTFWAGQEGCDLAILCFGPCFRGRQEGVVIQPPLVFLFAWENLYDKSSACVIISPDRKRVKSSIIVFGRGNAQSYGPSAYISDLQANYIAPHMARRNGKHSRNLNATTLSLTNAPNGGSLTLQHVKDVVGFDDLLKVRRLENRASIGRGLIMFGRDGRLNCLPIPYCRFVNLSLPEHPFDDGCLGSTLVRSLAA